MSVYLFVFVSSLSLCHPFSFDLLFFFLCRGRGEQHRQLRPCKCISVFEGETGKMLALAITDGSVVITI